MSEENITIICECALCAHYREGEHEVIEKADLWPENQIPAESGEVVK